MTQTKTTLVLAAAGMLVLAGIGLKLARYAEADSGSGAAIIQQITGYVGTDGWSLNPKVPIDRNGSLTLLTFHKSNCPRPFRVALLGSTDGLDSYLRQRFGDDIYYIQNGVRRARPSMVHFHWTAAAAIVRQTFGGAASIRQQIFAVVPSHVGDQTSCAAPDMTRWQQTLNR